MDWPNGAKAFFGTAQIAVAPIPEATDDPGASTDAPTTSDTTASPSATDGPPTAAPSAGSVDGNGDPALLEGTAAPTDGGDSSPSSVYMAGGLIIAVVVVAVVIVFVVWQRRQVSQLKVGCVLLRLCELRGLFSHRGVQLRALIGSLVARILSSGP